MNSELFAESCMLNMQPKLFKPNSKFPFVSMSTANRKRKDYYSQGTPASILTIFSSLSVLGLIRE